MSPNVKPTQIAASKILYDTVDVTCHLPLRAVPKMGPTKLSNFFVVCRTRA